MRLNPIPPDEYLWTLGGINFFRGRFDEALANLSQMRNPEPAYRLMAAAAAMAGQIIARRAIGCKRLDCNRISQLLVGYPECLSAIPLMSICI